MSQEEAFDGVLLGIARQHTGGVHGFLDTFFSFLQRKTDFYTGSGPEHAEQVMLGVFRKHAALALEKEKQKAKEEEKVRKQREAREEAERRAKEEAAKKAAEPKIVELPDDEEPAKAEAKPAESSKPAEESAKPSEAAEGAEGAEGEEEEGKGAKPNAGNGGSAEHYTWTQNLGEVGVRVDLGMKLRSRDLDIEIAAKRLRVTIKRGPTLIDGELSERVKPPECFWTLEDGNTVNIHLTKANQVEWWKSVIKGHPEINVQKVQPENSKLEDLDGDVRQTVEKMMYDQRQKAMGLPTSDEQEKRKLLSKFMSQHPEMDFSQVKFS